MCEAEEEEGDGRVGSGDVGDVDGVDGGRVDREVEESEGAEGGRDEDDETRVTDTDEVLRTVRVDGVEGNLVVVVLVGPAPLVVVVRVVLVVLEDDDGLLSIVLVLVRLTVRVDVEVLRVVVPRLVLVDDAGGVVSLLRSWVRLRNAGLIEVASETNRPALPCTGALAGTSAKVSGAVSAHYEQNEQEPWDGAKSTEKILT